MVTTRPEHEAAQDEYESFLAQSELPRGDLQHIALEEVDFLASFTAADVSGVLIGASPYNADTPAADKTRSQQYVEEQIRELLAMILKEGIPLLRGSRRRSDHPQLHLALRTQLSHPPLGAGRPERLRDRGAALELRATTIRTLP